MRENLNTLGYDIITVNYDSGASLIDILTWCGFNCSKMYYLISGMSPRDSSVNHVVVCKGNKMIHDPHPSNAMIKEPGSHGFWDIEIIVRML